MKHLMKCGCVANATCSQANGQKFNPPIPSCVIHDCKEVADEQPDLTGRKSICSYGGAERDSSYNLAFFEYRGSGSRFATETCSCGFIKSAHTEQIRNKRPGVMVCSNFTATGPAEFDRYYCGCFGWD